MAWKYDPNDQSITSRIKTISDVVPVRLNDEEKAKLAIAKEILEQTKDSTVIKQLVEIGFIVLHDPTVGSILKTVFDNKRKNERLNVIDYI